MEMKRVLRPNGLGVVLTSEVAAARQAALVCRLSVAGSVRVRILGQPATYLTLRGV